MSAGDQADSREVTTVPGRTAELRRLEQALADRDPEGIDGGLPSLLADDFREFGRSGTVWTRDSIAPLLERGAVAEGVRLDDFEVHELSDGVVLVTYRGAMALRSSIWIRRAGRWQLRFHQGTPVPDARAP
jgi:glyoxylase I family protein